MKEIISKSKIEEYFNGFKRENPLFPEENLDLDKIDEWIKTVLGDGRVNCLSCGDVFLQHSTKQPITGELNE